MSWDVIFFAWPPGARSLEELAPGYRPPPLGTRAEVIAKIEAAVPDVDFRDPTWGQMISLGRDFVTVAWWLPTLPGLAILLTVLAINLVGDRLRDALDPRAI